MGQSVNVWSICWNYQSAALSCIIDYIFACHRLSVLIAIIELLLWQFISGATENKKLFYTHEMCVTSEALINYRNFIFINRDKCYFGGWKERINKRFVISTSVSMFFARFSLLRRWKRKTWSDEIAIKRVISIRERERERVRIEWMISGERESERRQKQREDASRRNCGRAKACRYVVCRYIASFDTFQVRLRDIALCPPSRVVDGLRRGKRVKRIGCRYVTEEMGE